MSEEHIIKHKETLTATVTKTQDPFPEATITSKHQFLYISRFGDYTISSTPEPPEGNTQAPVAAPDSRATHSPLGELPPGYNAREVLSPRPCHAL